MTIFRKWYWRGAAATAAGCLAAAGVLGVLESSWSRRAGLFDLYLASQSYSWVTKYVMRAVAVGISPVVPALVVYAWLTNRYAPPDSAETRCRKCGYILRGLTEPRCSECGERI